MIGLNTHGGIIFAYLGGIALHVWTIKGYFETIDGSLEEAAALDGATPWQAFRLVLLPQQCYPQFQLLLYFY